MFRRYIVVFVIFLTSLLAGCNLIKNNINLEEDTEAALTNEARKLYQFALPEDEDDIAEIIVKDYGRIYIKLFASECPQTVSNFITCAQNGIYDGIPINRIIQNYMFQIGSESKDNYCEDEYIEKLQPYRGAVCAANNGEPNTNTNQFFLVQSTSTSLKELKELVKFKGHDFIDYLKKAYDSELSETQLENYDIYGGAPWLYKHNTVFGQLLSGYEIIDKISETETDDSYTPVEKILIESINIIKFKDLEEGYVG